MRAKKGFQMTNKLAGLNHVLKASLTPGEYPVSIIDFWYCEHELGGRVAVVFQFPDRTLEHHFFPNQWDYLTGTLLKQCGVVRDRAYGLDEALPLAATKTDLFTIVSYYMDKSGKPKINLSFSRPKTIELTDADIDALVDIQF